MRGVGRRPPLALCVCPPARPLPPPPQEMAVKKPRTLENFDAYGALGGAWEAGIPKHVGAAATGVGVGVPVGRG